MRGKIIFTIICFFLIFVSNNCVAEENSSFEVHEWGVFLKSYKSNITSVSTNSPGIISVLKPIIYLHSSEDLADVAIKVSSIKNATTEPFGALDILGASQSHSYPTASVENDSISWDIDIVNSSIKQNNITYSSLFYEGRISGHLPIQASIVNNGENITYYVKNIADYIISNVFLILRVTYYDFLWDHVWQESRPKGMLECVYFEDLNPGEEKTIVNTSTEFLYNKTQTKNMIRNNIISNGLAIDEADELIDYWSDWWFYPGWDGEYTALIYSIPQSVYDELLPLTITPQPDIIKRVGIFTITDIPTYGESFYNPYEPFEYIIDLENISFVTGPDYSNISVILSTDKNLYNINENISINLNVINTGEENIPITFSNLLFGDFEILNEKEEQVYHFSYNKSYLDITANLTIKPGENIELLNTSWNQIDNNQSLLPSGNYTIKGWLPAISQNIYSNNINISLQRETEKQEQNGKEKTPGFEIIIIISAISLILFLKRKRKTH